MKLHFRNISSESNQLIDLSSSLMEIQETDNKLKETIIKFRMYNLINNSSVNKMKRSKRGSSTVSYYKKLSVKNYNVQSFVQN